MSEPHVAQSAPPPNGSGGAATAPSPSRLTLIHALGETRAVWERGHRVREAVVPSHLPTREWLVRAAFALLALTALATITLAGVGLLGAGEAAGLSLPVVAVASLMIGFYLGNESGREERRPS